MKKDIIVIDCDDVIVDLKKVLVEAFNREYGLSMTGEEWNDYNLSKMFNIDMKDVIDVFHKYDIMNETKVFDYSVEAIEKMIDMGFKPVCLTARGWHSDAEEITKNYFEEHRIPVESIIILPDGINKGQYIQQEGVKAHAFIDDNFGHAKSVAETKMVKDVYLRNETWNSDACFNGLDNIQRVDTLMDVTNIIERQLNSRLGISELLNRKALSPKEVAAVESTRKNNFKP